MHMADALITPAVGGFFWAAAAGLTYLSIKKVEKEEDNGISRLSLMGVSAAFIFAAQMINFSIPGTGSSGHLGGGLLLAILLGPHAAFLCMTVILSIQSLFFADGGILALGCNIFNMGFFTCFIAYPFIFKPLTQINMSRKRLTLAALLAAVAGLQLGAFSVVLETLLSGRTELPFGTFVLMMQPVHLAIGIIEGLVTAVMVLFINQNAPEILYYEKKSPVKNKNIIYSLAAMALFTGLILSWFASGAPDGLEWSMEKTYGSTELSSPETGIHNILQAFQEKTAPLPDYALPEKTGSEQQEESWPAINAGTSLSGIAGGFLTLILTAGTGLLLHLFKIRRKKSMQAQ